MSEHIFRLKFNTTLIKILKILLFWHLHLKTYISAEYIKSELKLSDSVILLPRVPHPPCCWGNFRNYILRRTFPHCPHPTPIFAWEPCVQYDPHMHTAPGLFHKAWVLQVGRLLIQFCTYFWRFTKTIIMRYKLFV